MDRPPQHVAVATGTSIQHMRANGRAKHMINCPRLLNCFRSSLGNRSPAAHPVMALSSLIKSQSTLLGLADQLISLIDVISALYIRY
jgi:hypothetical protein